MLFTTTTQWVALAVALVAGWLFGLASHPGGRKWKDRYATEREAHAATRKDYDGQIAQARKDHDARIADANARHTEIERENARLVKAAPVPAAPVASRDRTVERDRPVDVVHTERPVRTGTGRGWFDWKSRSGVNG
ncbi:hypothetical protein M0208_04525 [Sphingomonas sp. SUN019]|uniref:hypothetical protein n=1 Tax=Sphingomonas sp. SUN019 TaxID=2937788 RepID=UPI0021647780|nr:hypothetical protein [Sphingomonas sp. SUN019]UVO49818.1 hypothetical protein M0208_04525 [Sphingomonas sp. SUN019]